MQIKIVAPPVMRGQVVLPSSKSISNRALVINALSERNVDVQNVSDCDDTHVMQKWLTTRPATVDIGAAGTAMRFSTALLALSEGEHVITGSERMKQRPIGVLVDALRTLGADISYMEKEGYPPLRIVGNTGLSGGELHLSGSVSSQYVSAILMIAPMMAAGLRLKLMGQIISRPYINMTLSIMRSFGAKARWERGGRGIVVEPVPYSGVRPFLVENDWSAASYWYEMVALSEDSDASIVLPGLFSRSLQGDCAGAGLFEQLGVITCYSDNDNNVVLRKQGGIISFLEYDFVKMPDLAQTFVVTCCMLGVPFRFTGLQSLKIKETDRIEALKREMGKLGFLLEERDGRELIWDGQRQTCDDKVVIDTYDDHRMAMAFAPAAMKHGCLFVNNPQVVTKSYPHFWDDLKSVGFQIEQTK